MPFSGAGTYSAPASSWNPAVDGTDINSTDWAALLADLSTALSLCVTKDGQQTTTSAIPFAQGITAPTSALGNVYSSTYTPTLTNSSNVTSSSATLTKYTRVGNVVTVGGLLTVQPTAAGAMVLRISLPVSSNFTLLYDCGGTANAYGSTESFAIYANAANDVAELAGNAVDTSSHGVAFTFVYLVK